MFGDARQHARADFGIVMKCEDKIRPADPLQYLMRTTRLTLDAPPDSQQGCQHGPRLSPMATGSWRLCEDCPHLRYRFPMLEPIGKHSERQGFDSVDCGLARLPISEHTRKFRHFRDPATVALLFDVNGQWQSGTSSQIWGAIRFDCSSWHDLILASITPGRNRSCPDWLAAREHDNDRIRSGASKKHIATLCWERDSTK